LPEGGWRITAPAVLPYFDMEQWPPALTLPEPAAISGGSLRRSIGLDSWKSHAMKSTSTPQNAHALRLR